MNSLKMGATWLRQSKLCVKKRVEVLLRKKGKLNINANRSVSAPNGAMALAA